MDAHKVRWVEQQLQLLHRSSRQVRRATDVEPGIVARTLDATHLIYRKDNRAGGCPNREPLEISPHDRLVIDNENLHATAPLAGKVRIVSTQAPRPVVRTSACSR